MNADPIAWLFAGQGSQHPGMGADLFARYPALTDRASYILGYPLDELCRDNPDGRLRLTQYAQPAIFVVTALDLLRRRETDPEPQFLVGHSLGEFSALYAAGALDFETTVRLVARRGELMGRATGGGMLAVIDVEIEALHRVLAVLGITELDVANINAANQLVLSGPLDVLAKVGAEMRRTRLGRAVPLPVSAAFHSRYLSNAAQEFAVDLAQIQVRPPAIPVVSTLTGRPYDTGQIIDVLSRQMTSPVLWRDCMRWLIDRGVHEIAELGPGTILTGLWRSALAEPAPVRSSSSSSSQTHRTPAATRRLGSADFRAEYGVSMAYLAGAMYRGIASVELVSCLAEAGLLGFFGSGGLSVDEVEQAVLQLRARAGADRFGMNLLHTVDKPELERSLAEMIIRHDVRYIEAASYTHVTAPLVLARFKGAEAHRDGSATARHVIAKVSRPEVAEAFMRPAPETVVAGLVAEGALTQAEATVARRLPVSGDVCVESDSGGHTDGGVALTLLPAMRRLRDRMVSEHGYRGGIRLGAAGGLGAPEAIAAVFQLGADFVVTGSVNQCTPQSGTSDAVRDMLAQLDVQDTGYAPAGDTFEMGGQVQVVRRGTMFLPRAAKLVQLYRELPGLEQMESATRASLERSVFRRGLDDVWQEVCAYHRRSGRDAYISTANMHPKRRLAMIVKWYFAHSMESAIAGKVEDRANFQIHCGPAMGAFNRVCENTSLSDWRQRDPGSIADLLMTGAAAIRY